MNKHAIIGVTPFEIPDSRLVYDLQKAGSFPVLSLGHCLEEAELALQSTIQSGVSDFGVCIHSQALAGIPLPQQVSLIIAPYGLTIPAQAHAKILYQVFDLETALAAQQSCAAGIIVKGNEAAGRVAYESSFILFQRVIQAVNLPVWVQGGIGTHTAASVMAQGAAGIVLDSQLAMFPECQAPAALKNIFGKLSGTETKLIDG